MLREIPDRPRARTRLLFFHLICFPFSHARSIFPNSSETRKVHHHDPSFISLLYFSFFRLSILITAMKLFIVNINDSLNRCEAIETSGEGR